ncbi:MAG: BrnA antitoxin family protein [Herpetosiphon sp.]|nr:BrnA antitoxin family protein [Herpetosiphon sp.]
MNKPSTKQPSRTNWAKIDALTDDDIDTSDIPALPADFTDGATILLPRNTVMLQVDPDILAWFKAQGADFERRMNVALRIYADAHLQS